MRFANAGGMHGAGTYFADNANYSIDYQHPKAGEFQLLLCFVIVGDTVVLPNG
jgi:hypothetical protein